MNAWCQYSRGCCLPTSASFAPERTRSPAGSSPASLSVTFRVRHLRFSYTTVKIWMHIAKCVFRDAQRDCNIARPSGSSGTYGCGRAPRNAGHLRPKENFVAEMAEPLDERSWHSNPPVSVGESGASSPSYLDTRRRRGCVTPPRITPSKPFFSTHKNRASMISRAIAAWFKKFSTLIRRTTESFVSNTSGLQCVDPPSTVGPCQTSSPLKC